MRTSDSTDKLYPALMAAQQEAGVTLTRDTENAYLKTKYASFETLLNLIRPVLQKNKIMIVQGSGAVGPGQINIVTRLIHESGQWIETDFPISMAKQDAQGTGSAATYGRRYALKGIMSLAEADDDGHEATELDPRKDRSSDAMKALTDGQIKELNHLFQNLEAKPEEISATCDKFSAGRTDQVDALMKSEATRLLAKLRKKLQEKSMV